MIYEFAIEKIYCNIAQMSAKSISSKVYSVVRAGAVAVLIPIFFIYMMIGKPDYKVVNAAAGIVVPAAGFLANGLTWPLRVIGKIAEKSRVHGAALRENRKLRAKLDELMHEQTQCQFVIAENQHLAQKLDIATKQAQKVLVARVIHDHSAIGHNTFILDRGDEGGIAPGMAVVSFDGALVGIVTTVSIDSAKVRAITDARSTIPVRVAGTDVYGFLRGAGVSPPVFEFYSDPEFVPTAGNHLITSTIKGGLPDGIPVGMVTDVGKASTKAAPAAVIDRLHDVMVLSFDSAGKYK